MTDNGKQITRVISLYQSVNIYPLPIKMHYSVASSDINTWHNMITFRASNCVNSLSVGEK